MPSGPPNPALARRIETGLRIVSPVLDLALALADRASRLLTRDDPDYVPARMPRQSESAPRGLTRLPEHRL